jgi:hypothetical protein
MILCEFWTAIIYFPFKKIFTSAASTWIDFLQSLVANHDENIGRFDCSGPKGDKKQ